MKLHNVRTAEGLLFAKITPATLTELLDRFPASFSSTELVLDDDAVLETGSGTRVFLWKKTRISREAT